MIITVDAGGSAQCWETVLMQCLISWHTSRGEGFRCNPYPHGCSIVR